LLANAFGHAMQLQLTHCIRQQAGSYGHAFYPASTVTRPVRLLGSHVRPGAYGQVFDPVFLRSHVRPGSCGHVLAGKLLQLGLHQRYNPRSCPGVIPCLPISIPKVALTWSTSLKKP
jgi:hypothetical protein